MPSPFPGMNPYFEHPGAWVDFHNRFVMHLADLLNERTGDDFFAKVEDQVYIHELPPDRWRSLGRPDVSIKPTAAAIPSLAPAAPVASASDEIEIELVDPLDIVTLPYIEVIDRERRQVVTAIELLSPSNKMPGPDRDQYAQQRLRLTNSQVNFVELDSLRGGPRHSFRHGPPACDYYALVYRPGRWPRAGIQTVRLRESLPTIAIPLRVETPDIRIDLQQLLHGVYDAGKYRAYIYDREPDPPLPPDDAAWAAQFVPARPE
jgi:hypothetical protein